MDHIEAIRQIAQREPVIDDVVIERIRQRRASLVKVLVDAYLEEAPRYFQDLRKAVAAADFAGARSAAHGLRSCSYNLGAVRLAKICQEAESVAGGSDIALLQTALDHVGPALFASEEGLKAIRLSVTTPGQTGPARPASAA